VISLESRTLHQSAKLKNVPKNEYGFTLFKFFVNQNYAFLSIAKSIECSSFTARCRISVQLIRINLRNHRGFRGFFPCSPNSRSIFWAHARTSSHVEMSSQNRNDAGFEIEERLTATSKRSEFARANA
jgi:hypothetical protein